MADHSRHVAKTFGASVHLAYFDVAEKHICDEMPLFGFEILVYLVTPATLSIHPAMRRSDRQPWRR
jgi:hypothetical protein